MIATSIALAANVCTWTGTVGDGKWSTAGNWDVAPVSGNGDTLSFSGPTAAKIVCSNDIAELSVAGLRFWSAGEVEISGEPITLTGTEPWNCTNSLTRCSCALTMNCASTAKMTLGGAVEFYETVTHGGGTLNIGGVKDVTVNFWKGFSSPTADIDYGANVYCHFQAKSYIKNIKGGSAYLYGALYFHAPGNEIGEIRPRLWTVLPQCADAFGADTVWSWDTGYIEDTYNRSYYELGGFDQTINRFNGSTRPQNGVNLKGYSYPIKSSGSSATLTCRATADSVPTYAYLMDSVALVWDPVGNYTVDFRDRIHSTTQPLTVKGGTMRLSGEGKFGSVQSIFVESGATFDVTTTNKQALAGLTLLRLGTNATFSISSETPNPFTDSKLKIEWTEGAQLSIPAGMTVKVSHVFLNGMPVPSATYGKGDLPQLVGDGSLEVATWADAYWTGAAGTTDWFTAANWTGVALADAVTARVLKNDADVTVDVAGPVALPALEVRNEGGHATVLNLKAAATSAGKLIEIGRNAKVRVEDSFVWDGTGSDVSYPVKFTDGGVFEVAGGSAVFTNEAGHFNVGGSARNNAGTVKVSGGSFSFGNKPFYLFANGTLDLSGDSLMTFASAPTTRGGLVTASGNAVLRSDAIGFNTILQDGDYRFAGNSKFVNNSVGQSRWWFSPSAAGKRIRIEVTDNASLDFSKCDVLIFNNGTVNGDVDVMINTTASMNWGNAVYWGNGNNNNNVRAGLDFRKGYIYMTAYEWDVGNGGAGYLKVSGGVLDISPWRQTVDTTSGLVVGKNSQGVVELSGGAITNRNTAFVHVGYGVNGRGTVKQTGGEMLVPSTRPMIIGGSGSTGLYELSGGVVSVNGAVLVGGYNMNNYPSAWVDAYGNGTLRVTGGNFAATKSIVLARHGAGLLEIGAAGTVRADGLLLENCENGNTGTAYAGVLRFVPGASTSGTLSLTGKLAVSAGAKLVVDATNYTAKRRVCLATYASKEGDFAAEDVTLLTAPDREFKLSVDDQSITLIPVTGAMLFIR